MRPKIHTRERNKRFLINRPMASKKKIEEVPVDLTEEERVRYEKEADMIYYQNIIENKLASGEEVTDEDLKNLDKASDIYEDEIRQDLSVEAIVRL